MAERDHYAILGVAPSADVEEIRSAFRQKVITAHPDNGGSRRQLAVVRQAWEVLRDPELRAAYDVELGLRPPPASAGASAGGRGRVRVKTGKKVHGSRLPSFAEIAGAWVGKAYRALAGVPEGKKKVGRAAGRIVACVHCGQKLRLKGKGSVRARCPKCRHLQPVG